MPVRLPPVTEPASRVLLEGILDYAGLFPPAAVSMPVAVRNFAHYRASGAGWLLGRFVCAASALDIFSEHADSFLPRDAGAIPWRLTVTGSGDIDADLRGIADFNDRHRVCFDECGAVVDMYEVRAASMRDIAALDAALPRELLTYMELPFADVDTLVPAVAAAGRRAKMRTGGVTAEAFPSADAIVHFLRVCLDHEVSAKATAGLHHPLRGDYRLTYDADAATGRMFGFLNVFLAAALLMQGADEQLAKQLIIESDPTTIQLSDELVVWRHGERRYALDRPLLMHTREHVLASFGSCSFTEPVNELRTLQWL